MSPQPKRSGGFSLDDYVDVAERLQDFKDAHPDGSLQTIDWGVQEVGGRPFVWYRAAAYRTADDERPGHGIAWEPFPGPSNYTRDSELMNAETAAWGRAIVALGLAANRKLASRQEVRARTQKDDDAPADDAPKRSRAKTAAKATPAPAKAPAAPEGYKPSPEAVTALLALAAEKGLRTAQAEGQDADQLFRFHLAMFRLGNEGDVTECVAAITDRSVFESLWGAVESCDQP